MDAVTLTDRSLGTRGPEWDEAFAAGAGVQTSRAWFEASATAALPPGARPQMLAATMDGRPIALFPMLAAPGRHLASLTTPYTCLYAPLLQPGAPSGAVRAAFAAFGRHCRYRPITRLDALDPASPALPLLFEGFAAAGLRTRRFDHFANWHAPVPAGSWNAYLQGRPGRLRETIRRKLRAVGRTGIRIEIVDRPAELAAALDAYEAVYARSWKVPEPFPAFNAALVTALAGTGALRVAVMREDGLPIAAQYWTVGAGTATVLKLAHDDSFKALSPGTVLTAAAIRHLIEHDRVTELDFGRGDDPYKQAWTGQRRMRIGLLAIDPRRPAGLAALARHDLGHLLRSWRQRPKPDTDMSGRTD